MDDNEKCKRCHGTGRVFEHREAFYGGPQEKMIYPCLACGGANYHFRMSCVFCSSEHGNEFMHERICSYPKKPNKPLLSTRQITCIQTRAMFYRSLTRHSLSGNTFSVARLLALYAEDGQLDREFYGFSMEGLLG